MSMGPYTSMRGPCSDSTNKQCVSVDVSYMRKEFQNWGEHGKRVGEVYALGAEGLYKGSECAHGHCVHLPR